MNESKTNLLAKKMTELCKQYTRNPIPVAPQAFILIIIGLWRGVILSEPRQRMWSGQG